MNTPLGHVLKFLMIGGLLLTGHKSLAWSGQDLMESGEWFSTQQGLPHNVIISLLQDRKGYLWIGTYNGLCRYDGYEFRLFREELNPGGLNIPHAVETIFEDRSGRLWIGTRGGLVSCFDPRIQKWRAFRSGHTVTTSISCFYEDEEGVLWLGTRDGFLGSIQEDAGEIRLQKLLGTGIAGILSYSRNSLLLLGERVSLYSKKTGRTWEPAEPWAGRMSGSNTRGYGFFAASVGLNTLYLLSFADNQTSMKEIKASFSTGAKLGQAFSKDRAIFFSDNILYSYTPEGDRIDSIRFSSEKPIPGLGEINAVLQDRDEILWVATNSGLLKLDKKKMRFRHLVRAGIPAECYIRSLYSTGEGLLVGRKKSPGLRIDNHISQVLGVYYESGIPEPLSTINCYLKTKDGQIYAGCQEGIARFQPGRGAFVLISLKQPRINNPLFEVWTLYEDRNGNLWLGTNKSGLWILNPREGTVRQIRYFSSQPGTDPQPLSVWSIQEDRNHQIWVGTNKGLYRFRTGSIGVSERSFDRMTVFGRDTLKGGHVWNIMEDRHGKLWIGTTDEGMNILSPNRDAVLHLNISNGLPSNAISAMLEDRYGCMWISTMNGLIRLREDGTSQIYTDADGLISNDFNFKAAARDERGRLYFGTKLGIVYFDPAEFVHDQLPDPLPVIEVVSVSVNGDYQDIPFSEPLVMPYYQNFFQFRFSLLTFRNPRRHKYRYQLEGLENHWNITTNNNPFARYTQVPPGEYVLKIQASVDGRHWSPSVVRREISIEPAIWQQLWFKIMVLALLAALIGLGLRLRITGIIRREKERTEFTRKLAELELTALQSQMNPHFIFNSIHAIQHYVLNHDVMAANEYLTNFAKLMRLFLQSSKEKYISLKNELEIIQKYLSLESLRFEHSFVYDIEVDSGVSMDIRIPTMLLQPFVENSINHGLLPKKEQGRLRIAIFREGTILVCHIDDDGIGRQKALTTRNVIGDHRSMGIALIRERINMYAVLEEQNLEIRITDKKREDGTATGTLVEIRIPINNWLNENANSG